MSTAVVVVHWNGLTDAAACLDSLTTADARVILVDNGSSDGSGIALAAAYPEVELLGLGRNHGFAGGANAGIARALTRGDDVVIVANDDVVVRPGAVEALADAVGQGPDLGLVGPEVHHAGGGFWYAGGALGFDPFAVTQIEQPPVGDRDVDYVPGCVVAVTRATLERVGPFDDRYFLMWEDADWSFRVRVAGLRTIVREGIVVEHAGSKSFGGESSPLHSYYFYRNMPRFAWHHAPADRRLAALRATIHRARATVRRTADRARRRQVARATLAGFAHFLIGRTGSAPRWLEREALRSRQEAG